jgi:AcrR family transcriptional regulator
VSKSKPGQREQIVAGMIDAAARYGYGGASIARVVEQAGVSRATFYEHFADREECFLAAYREVAGQIGRDVERVERERDAADRPGEILAGLLASADLNPAAARVAAIEGLAAGRHSCVPSTRGCWPGSKPRLSAISPTTQAITLSFKSPLARCSAASAT